MVQTPMIQTPMIQTPIRASTAADKAETTPQPLAPSDRSLPPSSEAIHPTLADLVQQIQQFEAIVAQWDDSQQAVVAGLKQAIEAVHREALVRLIRSVKAEAMPALKRSIEDEVVYGVLRYHDLIKAPSVSLPDRVQQALAAVRPSLQSHNGDVELVSIRLPDTVEVRFIGTCSHCPASALTLSDGVEQAIKQSCPEILHVIAVNTVSIEPTQPEQTEAIDPTWRLVTALAEIPDAGILSLKLEGKSILLYRQGLQVTAFRNACSHLGIAIDTGAIEQGILTCPAHGFRYDLTTGAGLTVADIPLHPYPVQVQNGQVFLQFASW